ncbi:IS5 family transposase [Methylobacterium trifolii]|uniref:IS5 family transposase ISMpo7 n=1 Tax=Methylobacterium trifolii TaxID=1003092 RepID=A0ABQ4U6V4_9HYPH|nr:IS5 family transposase ISMpo7 [Methylobacterium trifolii]
MAGLFWLSDAQWVVIEPHMPRNQPGPDREDDRRIISGILHVLTTGFHWRDCPADYGPRTTVYNRFNRWSRRGFWRATLTDLPKAGWSCEAAAIDSTYVRAHRSAHGGKMGQGARHRPVAWRPDHQDPCPHQCPRTARRPPAESRQRQRRAHGPEHGGHIRRLSADKGYYADWLRSDLRERAITPTVPGKRGRKRKARHDRRRYSERWRIEAIFCRREGFRRIATRYDKPARNYASAVARAAVIAFWR